MAERSLPTVISIGVFELRPGPISSRNATIRNLLTRQEIEIEPADATDLIDIISRAFSIPLE